MKFYTVQKRCTWNKWKKQGYIEAYDKNTDEFFELPYKWMEEQMNKRLPKYKGEIPVWLWTEKPSFFYRGWSDVPRKKFVVITLELDVEDVLLSNFDAWHIPLSNDQFDDGEPWERVFDLEWCRHIYCDDDPKYETLQGTTGRIGINKVTNVQYFTAKRPGDNPRKYYTKKYRKMVEALMNKQ